jgi:kinesin family protein 15
MRGILDGKLEQVKELEENTQYNKLILQFREDKIRRLESLSTGVLSADAYLMDENNAVMEELQLLRDLPVQNPEHTRLAMENLSLHEQLRRYICLERWKVQTLGFEMSF